MCSTLLFGVATSLISVCYFTTSLNFNTMAIQSILSIRIFRSVHADDRAIERPIDPAPNYVRRRACVLRWIRAIKRSFSN